MRICECGHPRSEHKRTSAESVLSQGDAPRDDELPANEGGNTITEAMRSDLIDDEHAVDPEHREDSNASANRSEEKILLMRQRQAASSADSTVEFSEEDEAKLDKLLKEEDEAQADLNQGEDPAPCKLCDDCNDWRPSQETVAPADDQTHERFTTPLDIEREKTEVQVKNEERQAAAPEPEEAEELQPAE